MEPTKFKHQNVVFAENQPEYKPLPALILRDSPGIPAISCWRMSLRERLYVLFTGRVWLSMYTFARPLTPAIVAAYREEAYLHPSDSKNKRLRLLAWWNRITAKCRRKKISEQPIEQTNGGYNCRHHLNKID